MRCQLCRVRGCQPCADCGAGLRLCEPCIESLAELRCPACQLAKVTGNLKVYRLLLYCYQLRAEREAMGL